MVSVIMLALWVTGTAFESENEKLLGTVLPFRIRQFMDTYFLGWNITHPQDRGYAPSTNCSWGSLVLFLFLALIEEQIYSSLPPLLLSLFGSYQALPEITGSLESIEVQDAKRSVLFFSRVEDESNPLIVNLSKQAALRSVRVFFPLFSL